MTEQTEAAGIGHNRPPAYDAEAIAAFKATVSERVDAVGAWLDVGAIDDEQSAQQANDLLHQLRMDQKAIDKKRVEDKAPWLAGGKAVDAAYAAIMAPLDKGMAHIKRLLTDWAREKARQELAQRQRDAEAARLQREAAEKAFAEAEARKDVMGEADAERALKDAQKAEREALRDRPVGQVASATGGGRTGSLRTSWDASVDDLRPLAIWIMDHHRDEFVEFALKLARAAKRGDRAAEVPGVTFIERKEFV